MVHQSGDHLQADIEVLHHHLEEEAMAVTVEAVEVGGGLFLTMIATCLDQIMNALQRRLEEAEGAGDHIPTRGRLPAHHPGVEDRLHHRTEIHHGNAGGEVRATALIVATAGVEAGHEVDQGVVHGMIVEGDDFEVGRPRMK